MDSTAAANSAPSQRPLANTKAPAEGDGVDTSPTVSDEIRKTTCYMCACRCGIDVHIKDGSVRYIHGNRDHPVNRGVLCGKGAAGIMQHHSPARLRKPLLRTGERGESAFREIEWDEALAIATERLSRIRATDPKRLAFFTGRDQSQSLTGWWGMQFGTPNYAAHGGFCSVNMAAGGTYTIGGSFWEFGEPDWDHARYFMLFGVAEDHDSNPIKIGLGKLKARGAKVVAVNPCRTGYGAIADEWLGIRPGTDGLFVLALVHELLKAGRIDLDYLARYTNAPALVIQEPGASDDGLLLRVDGKTQVWDRDGEARRRGRIASGIAGPDRPLYGCRPNLRPGFPAHRRALPRCGVLARRGGRALRNRGSRYSPDRGGDRRRRVQSVDRVAGCVDRYERAAPRDDARTPRRHPRHAGHLGAFQRLPHVPRAASPAGAARHDRCAGRISLQSPLPETDPARAQAGRPQRRRAQYAARRHAARLHHRARGFAPRCHGRADPHRQGLFVGRAALRPRPDAHGHRQCLAGRSRTRSTRCSCTCRTWRGTRR